ncbi:MAG: adenine deaminase [Deltaproteobacteria bacterium RBG_16_54_18]|nr:MAG: adenine deaminase [Deltaproteobacteria bacterium RBG_16_54_18]
MDIKDRIAYAKGEKPEVTLWSEADLLLTNAQLINVFSKEIETQAVAIAHGKVVGLGDYPARATIDLQGRYLAPGLIDAHVHIESSMVGVGEYARAVLPRGVTTVVTDFHEIVNVMGIKGIELMRRGIESIPLNLFVMLPSCVPATHLETAGAELQAEDLKNLMQEEWVKGLGEMMNFPGVIHGDPEVLKKIEMARGKRIDGHAPGLSGKELAAYIAAGISSDHECTTRAEAEEKLKQGMYLMIREGSTAKNLEELIQIVTPANAGRCMLVTDDCHPADLITQGGVDHCVRKAIRLGLDPITAIQMATLTPAQYFPLPGIGAIAPGYDADLVVIDDLDNFRVSQVFKQGRLIAENGKLISGVKDQGTVKPENTFNVPAISAEQFRIKAETSRAKVIEVIPQQIITKKAIYEMKTQDGLATADLDRDILKIAVVERHKGTGNIGLGFVKGFGLRQGAIASSVAHDSHNIVVVGTDDESMAQAVQGIVAMRGGLIATKGDKTLASLPLPIGGLMSDQTIEEVRDSLNRLHRTVKEMGGEPADPFMALSFLALPVIPELKITDKGLVDVTKFKIVPLFGDA